MFLRLRSRLSIAYLNLCIWLQQYRKRQLGQRIYEMQKDIAALGSRVMIDGVPHAVQINGRTVSHMMPITILNGQRITGVVLVPNKLVNFLVEIKAPDIAIPFVQSKPMTKSRRKNVLMQATQEITSDIPSRKRTPRKH